MPKSKANIVYDVQGTALQLTKMYLKQTKEIPRENYRVRLSDLVSDSPLIVVENYDDKNYEKHYEKHYGNPLRVKAVHKGTTIGCTTFDQENYDKIIKAARKAAKL